MHIRSVVRTLISDARPITILPTRVIAQLVGYYSDWRRSRDILSDPDEPRLRSPAPRIPEILSTNGLRSLRLR